MAGKAGDDEIANPAEPLERFAPPAERRAEADEFRQRARHHGRLGIVPETQAVAHSRAEGEDVF
jgi:hypothetical protein